MKMLVVSNMYPSAKDPTYGTFVKNFYEDICKRNSIKNTSLVTIKGRRKSKLAKLFTYLSFYTRLLTKLLFVRYDIIYVHTVTFPTPALRIASLFRRLPLIFNVHGDDVLPSNRFKLFLRNLSKPLVLKARLIVAPSEYFKNVVKEVFDGIAPERIFVSPSGGINPMFYSTKPHVNCGEEPITLGFVSRIDTGKGWQTYVDTIKLLKDDGILCRGIIAGGGSQVKELLSELDKNGLKDIISYVGPQSQNALVKLYRRFDLFVFPSTRKAESLGLVGIEAMASGVPVIASNMAGPTSYVIPGHNGFLFEPASSTDLKNKITDYLHLNKEEKEQMSANAYHTAQMFESKSVADKLYDTILSI